jgi:hypothetical protein
MSIHQNLTETIISFLRSININQIITDDTFLNGLRLSGHSILIDIKKMKFPGDILH